MNDNQNKRRIFSKFRRYLYTHIYKYITNTSNTHTYMYMIFTRECIKKSLTSKYTDAGWRHLAPTTKIFSFLFYFSQNPALLLY